MYVISIFANVALTNVVWLLHPGTIFSFRYRFLLSWPSDQGFMVACQQCILCRRFAGGFVYYGLSLNTSNLGGNPYLNFMLNGAVEIPGYICCGIVCKYLGRVLPLAVSFFMTGAVLLATIAVPHGMCVCVGGGGVTVVFIISWLSPAAAEQPSWWHILSKDACCYFSACIVGCMLFIFCRSGVASGHFSNHWQVLHQCGSVHCLDRVLWGVPYNHEEHRCGRHCGGWQSSLCHCFLCRTLGE